MITIKQAAQQKECTIMTIRRAIQRGQINHCILNPEDHKFRHIIRILDDDKWQAWEPGQRRKSAV